MKTKFKIILAALLIAATTALTILYVSSHDIAVLNPKGIIGLKQRELLIVASSLMLIVVVPVFFLTLFFAWKYRESNDKSKYTPEWSHSYVAESAWWGVPFAIIIALAIITWKSTHDLSPFKPLDSDVKPLKIQVVALDWKWLFIYPEEGIATINYIQFPVDTPISFEITADAPMNSFWIPQLGGQIYAMPSMRSRLHLIANEAGTYRGASANISGKGFAGMIFWAKASSQSEYNDWVREVKSSSKSLNIKEYQSLVAPTEDVPKTYYHLQSQNLFDWILEKYEPTVNNNKKINL